MEVGSFRLLNARMKRTEPDCGGHRFSIALGLEKLVSLFAILCAGHAMATTICMLEMFTGCGRGKMFGKKQQRSFLSRRTVAWINGQRQRQWRRRRSF